MRIGPVLKRNRLDAILLDTSVQQSLVPFWVALGTELVDLTVSRGESCDPGFEKVCAVGFHFGRTGGPINTLALDIVNGLGHHAGIGVGRKVDGGREGVIGRAASFLSH